MVIPLELLHTAEEILVIVVGVPGKLCTVTATDAELTHLPLSVCVAVIELAPANVETVADQTPPATVAEPMLLPLRITLIVAPVTPVPLMVVPPLQ